MGENGAEIYAYLMEKFRELVELKGFKNKVVECNILGADFVELPSNEYALMRGKEFLVDCRVDHYHGEAFTDSPKPFKGKVIEVARMALGECGDRAIFFATLNAVLRAIGEIDRPIHCRKIDAERCGHHLAEYILNRFGRVKVAHIGFQPGHVKASKAVFDEVYVTDLNPENVGKVKFGIEILDGSMNEDVIRKVDVACITGSAIVNGTLFKLLEWCKGYGTKYILYGVTMKGAAKLLGYEVFCPFGQNEDVLPSSIR